MHQRWVADHTESCIPSGFPGIKPRFAIMISKKDVNVEVIRIIQATQKGGSMKD